MKKTGSQTNPATTEQKAYGVADKSPGLLIFSIREVRENLKRQRLQRTVSVKTP